MLITVASLYLIGYSWIYWRHRHRRDPGYLIVLFAAVLHLIHVMMEAMGQ